MHTAKRIEHILKKGFLSAGVFCLLLLAGAGTADTGQGLLGDSDDGSRAVPVHFIPLIDEEGEKVTPDDDPLLPFSTRETCGFCHDYKKISAGWHFNAAEPNVIPGRNGQPWILVDAGSGTQVPLSYRSWPGAFRPEQLGLTSWQFVLLFGRQMPGGGVGELDTSNPDEAVRQFVSGKLQINCMTCHSADPAHDQAEYAVQIARQNLRWAAAATCGFASVSGSAARMPDTYDPLMPEPLDDPKLIPPSITYRKDAFDHRGQVFFDLVTKIPSKRCYFCHSNQDVYVFEAADCNNKILDVWDGVPKWLSDEDVHLSSGMDCVSCHRNDIEHDIERGISGPLSCEGCHIPQPPRAEWTWKVGTLGAPIPKHAGIPPVHFDKLTCTACHSGIRPKQRTMRAKTSRAHALGTHNADKSPVALPHVIYPVFAEQEYGKIGPCKLIWPAFWASLEGEEVEPIAIETVRQGAEMIAGKNLPRFGDWPALSAERIAEDLVFASNSGAIEGQAVYVSGGKLYRLDDSGQLVIEDHPAAKPYLWPIAHYVRPAAQSLGVGGCGDCHSANSPFFFGDVEVDTPATAEKGSVKKMVEFQNLNPTYTKLFAMSFVFRPFLKIVALCSCAIIGIVLLLYGLKAVLCITKAVVEKD